MLMTEIFKFVSSKEGLEDKINELRDNCHKDSLGVEVYAEKLTELLNQEGLEITKEEVLAGVSGKSSEEEGELSDDELERVAGGGCGRDPQNYCGPGCVRGTSRG